jgi:trehalose-phosphatase
MSRPLFETLDELGPRIAQAPHLLLSLDFDGTLTPIELHPDMVRMPPHGAAVLQALHGAPQVSLMIIGGRERTDLQGRVGVAGLIYAGNHGLEISGPGLVFVEPTAVECRGALQALAADLAHRVAAFPGAFLEDKGLTLSIHYRQAPPDSAEPIRQTVHGALANASHPFQLTTGTMVFDVRPRVTWGKGTAVNWIRGQLSKPNALAIYIGDDATDEDAFACLADDITIKVGGGPSETAAAFQVESHEDVWRFLTWLRTVLEGREPLVVGARDSLHS